MLSLLYEWKNHYPRNWIMTFTWEGLLAYGTSLLGLLDSSGCHDSI